MLTIIVQISWGTKQDSTPDLDLGAVVQDSHSQVDVEMLTEIADINSIYIESLTNLRDRVPVDNGKSKGLMSIAEKEHAAKDYYADVRTNVLLAWVLSNVCCYLLCSLFTQHRRLSTQGLLLIAILSGMKETDAFGKDIGLTKVKGYMIFILTFTAMTNFVVRTIISFLGIWIDVFSLQRFIGSTTYLLLRLITG